jgi:hypothetical protein
MLYLALQWNKYPLVSKEKERKSSNDLGQEEEEEFWAATSEDPFLLKLYWHRLHSIVEHLTKSWSHVVQILFYFNFQQKKLSIR